MIKYSTIKKMFSDRGVELLRIHTPAIPKKTSAGLTSFYIKIKGETYNIPYEIKCSFITEEDVEKIVRLVEDEWYC